MEQKFCGHNQLIRRLILRIGVCDAKICSYSLSRSQPSFPTLIQALVSEESLFPFSPILSLSLSPVLWVTRYRSHLCIGETVRYDDRSHQQSDLKVCNESLYTMTICSQNSSWSIFLLGQSILLFYPETVHE